MIHARSFPGIFLTAGLFYVFLFFGIDKFLNPLLWIGWMPLWMEGLLSFTRDQWLMIVGATEIIVAILLVIPLWKIRLIGTVIAVLHLVTILTQTGVTNDVGIRDVGLLSAALALLALEINRHSSFTH